MKTTKKQLANFAIGLVKEVSNQNKHISVEYRNSHIDCWFYANDMTNIKCITLFGFDDLKTNKDKFKKAILKIRGIVK